MKPRFTPRQIDAFLLVAQAQSFRIASQRMNLTPSAISNLISELEVTLGFALFNRTTRRVALTPEGRRFLPSATAVQRQLAQAALAAVDIRSSATDVVRIAAPLVIASTLLPRIIAMKPPELDVAIRVIDTAVVWLTDRITAGEADLAIGPDREMPRHITRTALFDTPWVLWCRPDHPLAAAHHVAWSDLHDIDLIAGGRDHEERIWPQLMAQGTGHVPQRVQIVDHISTSLGFAAMGLGLTFSPDYVAPLARSFGLVRRALIHPIVGRQLCLYAPQEDRVPRSLEAVRKHILETAASAAADMR